LKKGGQRMGFLMKLLLKMRFNKRLGAFVKARKQGMTTAEARAYANDLYPPTEEDLVYEEKIINRPA
jgi:hypothetical protein